MECFFYPHAAWDDRDRFSEICVHLFDALVVAPAGLTDVRFPQMYTSHPPAISSLHVIPKSGLRIMINRSDPPTGYWDDPVDLVLPSDGARFEFVAFFDWAKLDRRDFKYVEVAIREFVKHPRLVGRRALIEFDCVGIFTDA